jgi:6-pyruvoyltetrahydropterin/6-carboxytetrahydropterin synthase
MWVELEGEPDEKGMLIDFKDVKSVLKPLVEAWDHATLVAEDDHKLLEAVKMLDSKHFVLPFDSTSENICQYVIEYIMRNASDSLKKHCISKINVRLQETETCYAEMSSKVSWDYNAEKKHAGAESFTY